jgi:hypothetical protein
MLDPRPRGVDGFGWAQDGQGLRSYEHLNATRQPRLAPDEPGALQGEHHLVYGGRAHPEVALHVGLGRRAAVDSGVGVDEGQVLTLLVGEALPGHSPHG